VEVLQQHLLLLEVLEVLVTHHQQVRLKETMAEQDQIFHLEVPLVVVELELLEQIIQAEMMDLQEELEYPMQFQELQLITAAVEAVAVGITHPQELVELAEVEMVEDTVMEIQEQLTLVEAVEAAGLST